MLFSAQQRQPGGQKMVIVVLMGVCGCGKTTVGEALAEKLQWPFRDADEFHSEANKRKMSSGTPLTDEDRFPWLRSIYDYITSVAERKECTVLTCSALKRRYRDILRTGITTTTTTTTGSATTNTITNTNTNSNTTSCSQTHTDSQPSSSGQSSSSTSSPSEILFVHLTGSRMVLETRLRSRQGHFMPSDLLTSQLETLEEPGADERCLRVDVENSVQELVECIVARLQSGS